MLYTAFVADIVNSRKLQKADREHIQVFIKECMAVLNIIFKPSLEFDVVFSAGDEVQGLFVSPSAAYLYIRLFKLLLYPLKLRCGIGVGEWEVRIKNGTTNEQDGSAYHYARAAILAAHEKNDCSILFNSKNEYDIFINTFINTSLLYSNGHSQKQHQLLLLTELTNPFYETGSMDMEAFPKLLSLVEKDKDLIIAGDFEPYNVFSPVIADNKLTLASSMMKGLPKKISGILNTSRQNVDKVIKSGHIAEIRSVDTAVLLLIRKNFAG